MIECTGEPAYEDEEPAKVSVRVHGKRQGKTRRCEQMAVKGTGTGICDHPLDEHGQCSNASNHTDEFQGERRSL